MRQLKLTFLLLGFAGTLMSVSCFSQNINNLDSLENVLKKEKTDASTLQEYKKIDRFKK